MADKLKIEIIIDSFIRDRGRKMVKQIDDYGLYDFWADLADHLDPDYSLFVAMTVTYFRIKNR